MNSKDMLSINLEQTAGRYFPEDCKMISKGKK